MNKKLVDFLTILQDLKPFLEQNYFVSEMAVFGSYARGEEKPGSDLDVLVSYSKIPDLFDLAALNLFLEKKLGIKIDLVPNLNLKPRIAQHILSEKIDVV
jgi:uncharacterized protein